MGQKLKKNFNWLFACIFLCSFILFQKVTKAPTRLLFSRACVLCVCVCVYPSLVWVNSMSNKALFQGEINEKGMLTTSVVYRNMISWTNKTICKKTCFFIIISELSWLNCLWFLSYKEMKLQNFHVKYWESICTESLYLYYDLIIHHFPFKFSIFYTSLWDWHFYFTYFAEEKRKF